MTISLSDQISKTRRVIQIKPVESLQKKENFDLVNQEIHEVALINRIENEKAKLEAIESHQQELLEKIQEQIATEKKDWIEEKSILIEETKEKAYTEGLQLGKDEIYTNYNGLLEQANSIVKSAEDSHYEKVARSEETMVELAVKIAEKIIHIELDSRPEDFFYLVEAALMKLESRDIVRIFVHPKVYVLLEKRLDELEYLVGKNVSLQLLVKQDLAEVACLIEHPFGEVDLSVETQLNQLEEMLTEIAMERNI